MATVKSIVAQLKSKGKETTRRTYSRHGVPADRMFGVSIADLKVIAKGIKGEQQLALDLFETGNLDAMYLAGMVANGMQMTKSQLQAWAKRAGRLTMVSEYSVPWVAVENPHARDLAMKWINSKDEHIASCGWSTYAGIVATTVDESLDLAEIKELLNTAVREISGAQNRVRYTMNAFVIAVGVYVRPLLAQAKAVAKQIGEVSVDMGDTACKVPLATAYIEKCETGGRVGIKRKTIRC
ncbi:MAG: DNA alkylation repair protein [Acidobacteriota bacterium]